MIGHHFSISAFWNAAKPSGVCCAGAATSRPSSVNFALTAGSASTWRIAPLSLSIASFGVPFGAQKPNQPDIRKPGTPPSADVGMSGIEAERSADRFAIAFDGAGTHLRQRDCTLHHEQVDLAGDQVGHRRAGAAIG